MKSSKDKTRTQFFYKFIVFLFKYFIGESEFSQILSKVFEGNYAMIPFFNNKNGMQKQRLSVVRLSNMMNLWKNYQTSLPTYNFRNSIQLIYNQVLQLLWQMNYTIFSVFTHIFYALKQSTNYINGESTYSSVVKQAFHALQVDY
ncbi:unnamed protein product (macronuclear) [Paramecium tetraurelia]|uniref:Transmembrane protein n=1 Tax=Paramecium tetraurelia TaxID=5888 RepID=A0CEK9_PARTE|nr:uncharacterized protein GSPATT00037664001 [Paramecium tetraurelia]CAK69226.1 unnamed protein product [Paramecium tetraurelia]|eukprot:XP_001436623.1 hypothetical protein (macronuclear) [Paramecium tetraurelia strain d4-2]